MKKTLIALLSVLNLLSFQSEAQNFNWQIRKVGDTEWIPAKVPGTAAVSYRDAGLLDDIRYDDNLTRIDDGWYKADFEYRTSFKKPVTAPGERIILNFDGISWKADISLNGRELGRIEGSFIRTKYDITDMLMDDNVLSVIIRGQSHPGDVKIPLLNKTVLNGGILGADNPCFHASIGWDWLPTVPGRNIGIWNDVRLTRAPEGVVIEDAFFDTELDSRYYPGMPKKEPGYAMIHPTVSIRNFSREEQPGTLRICFGGILTEQKVTAAPGGSDLELDAFRLNNPELWWPVGYGEPHLYDVKVEWIPDAGAASTASPLEDASVKELRCGVRQMFYTLENNALQMYINGRRFIPKGGNWGFSEINLQFGEREYDIAFRFHKLMNFNMVRNWVGQIGDEEFYEACDRWGIMVWQDFWLANPSDGPDPDDNAMFVRNAEDMVHKVRPHACIALYCARNEGTPKRSLELHLNRIVATLCPRSLFIANSSEYCVSGQGPYRNLMPADYFRNVSTAVDIPVGDNKFHSERGAPCIPSYESLCRIFRPEHRWPQNDVWGMHNFTLGGAQNCGTLNGMIEKGLGQPNSLKEFSDRAQYVNFNTYRAMFESRSSHRNGLLLWMSHPAWPCLVFQTYDYWFDVNAAVYGAKRGAAPLRIQWNPALERIEVVNDCFGDMEKMEAGVRVYASDGSILLEKTASVDASEDSTVQVCEFKPDFNVPVYYLSLSLKKDGKLLAENFYWEGTEPGNWQAIPCGNVKDLKLSFSKTAAGHADVTVSNTGKVVLPMVRLKLLGKGKNGPEQILPTFYEDNYFSLLPGQTRAIGIDWIESEHTSDKISVAVEVLR